MDLERQEWQEVVIPLESVGIEDDYLKTIAFSGNLAGTFYIDDLRLVTGVPPVITDDAGRKVATGVYLCRMEAGEFSVVRKLVLVR